MANYTSGNLHSTYKHGHNERGKRSSTYNSWTAMLARCNNPGNLRYDDYGGRGIMVIERWLNFTNFLLDMGEKPDGLTLERRDNKGNYCKENCCWATYKEQGQNKRLYQSNKTGIAGVHAVKRRGLFSYWSAQCRRLNGSILTLYNGKDFFEACCRRKSWEAARTRGALS